MGCSWDVNAAGLLALRLSVILRKADARQVGASVKGAPQAGFWGHEHNLLLRKAFKTHAVKVAAGTGAAPGTAEVGKDQVWRLSLGSSSFKFSRGGFPPSRTADSLPLLTVHIDDGKKRAN